MRILCVVLLLIASQAGLAQRQLLTLPLSHAPAETLVSSLKPHLSTESTITAYHDQLILNVTDEELSKIRALLKKLDRPLKQLLISLKRGSEINNQQGLSAIHGQVGNNRLIVTTDPKTGITSKTRIRATVRQHDLNRSESTEQQLRATEGLPAFIAIGETLTLNNERLASDGRFYRSTELHPLNRGFYVTARVNNDWVNLDIDQRSEQYKAGEIQTQQLRSQVSGKAGEWIAIGSIERGNQQTRSGLGRNSTSQSDISTLLFLRVDLLD